MDMKIKNKASGTIAFGLLRPGDPFRIKSGINIKTTLIANKNAVDLIDGSHFWVGDSEYVVPVDAEVVEL